MESVFFPLAVILDSWLAEQKEKSFLFLFLLKYSMLLIRMRERCVFSNLVSFLFFGFVQWLLFSPGLFLHL